MGLEPTTFSLGSGMPSPGIWGHPRTSGDIVGLNSCGIPVATVRMMQVGRPLIVWARCVLFTSPMTALPRHGRSRDNPRM